MTDLAFTQASELARLTARFHNPFTIAKPTR
jgi:hypothetical protein